MTSKTFVQMCCVFRTGRGTHRRGKQLHNPTDKERASFLPFPEFQSHAMRSPRTAWSAITRSRARAGSLSPQKAPSSGVQMHSWMKCSYTCDIDKHFSLTLCQASCPCHSRQPVKKRWANFECNGVTREFCQTARSRHPPPRVSDERSACANTGIQEEN